MATVTFESDSTSSNNVTSYPSTTFSAAIGDVMLAFVTATATVAAGTMTDSLGEVTFIRITTALKAASGDTLYLFVSNGFATSTGVRQLTFDCTGDAATGAIITVYTISGMSKAGSAAVRQSAVQSNGSAAATPAPAFGVAALTANPVLGLVANATNPATMTKPASPACTEGSDSGFTTPLCGQETIWSNSGFTGTTVTWGSTSATAFGAIIVELDASSFPAGQDDDTPPRESLKYRDFEPAITVWQ